MRRSPSRYPVFILTLGGGVSRERSDDSERQHPAAEPIAGLHGYLQMMRIKGVYTIELDATSRGHHRIPQRHKSAQCWDGERRQHLRFALEPRKSFGIARQRRGQNLDRDFTIELSIAAAI